MASLRQIPPTAGHPIRARDVLRGMVTRGDLAAEVKALLGIDYARVTCSGTVALYLSLTVIKESGPKRTVVMPAFICPLVGLAIARAGMTIAVCDMQAAGQLDYDRDALAALCASNVDIAAIVVPHLGGMPADIDRIKAIAEPHSILLIEDGAQAIGAESGARKVGTLGDFAFFSFARGKGMTLYEGGVLVTKHAHYAVKLEEAYTRLVPKNVWMEWSMLGGLLGYALCYRPWTFWFIFDLTYLLWNRLGDEVRAAAEVNRLEFPIYRMGRLRQRLGYQFFRQLRPQIARQRESAQRYFAALEGKGDFRLIREWPGTQGTYPYVALVFATRARRDAVMHRLRARGLGAFIIYIRALADYDYMKPYMPPGEFPHARLFAHCTMTLSTSVFLRDRDRQAITRILTDEAAHA